MIREILPAGEDAYALATVHRHHQPSIQRGSSGYLYDADANSRVLAAAPDLLETLSDLVAVVETYDDAWNPGTDLYITRMLASEAERKARGEGDAL